MTAKGLAAAGSDKGRDAGGKGRCRTAQRSADGRRNCDPGGMSIGGATGRRAVEEGGIARRETARKETFLEENGDHNGQPPRTQQPTLSSGMSCTKKETVEKGASPHKHSSSVSPQHNSGLWLGSG